MIPVLLVFACAEPSSERVGPWPRPPLDEEAGDSATPDTASEDTGDEEPEPEPEPLADPFEPREVEHHGMVDVSEDLHELLEQGQLPGSCEAFERNPDRMDLQRMCGKEMFFYDPLGTVGVPAPLVDFLLNSMQDLVGPAFSEFGLIPDPYSETGLPLGMAPSAEDTYAFTCASCHFGQTPDGRYAVGMPNQDYDYGAHNLALTLVPMSLTTGRDQMGPEAVADIEPMLDALDADWWLKAQLGIALIGLLGTEIPEFPAETQDLYARWKPGTMDFLIAPLPLDDGVHTISRIPPLWGMPTEAEREAAGMEHALLGWTGNTPTTEEFVYWFGVLGGGVHPTAEQIEPLARYLESLEAPEPLAAEPGTDLGHELFVSECLDCHQGPRGSGLQVFDIEDIGTEAAITSWMDPSGTGNPCCNEEVPDDFVTGGIKSPRLVGLWAQDRFLHNGSVESLEALLCLEDREGVTEGAFGDYGHEFGCELSVSDREALVDWLESH
jgi:hypothetical protein